MSKTLMNFLRAERGVRGIYSVCSAHHWVIEAAMEQCLADDTSLLLEATSNQVNHQGGYTGMQPADFVRYVHQIAERLHFPNGRLILGGDHLGPNAWRSQPAAVAMQNALETVRAYALAGFTKIHLDASMSCSDDPAALPDATIAERAAAMCKVAEEACAGAGLDMPVYIIGTEVPPPGGATHALRSIEVTAREAVEKTLHVHEEIFEAHQLEAALERVIGIVVQPGVEFDHDSVVEYDRAKATHLAPFLKDHPQLVFEAHSTDYQLPEGLRQLVQDGFAILKVGPALTFAMREAIYALSAMERELHGSNQATVQAVMEEVMLQHPENWQKYYPGDAQTQRLLRHYSYSDRVRYYWPQPAAMEAVQAMVQSLAAIEIPETVLSQYLPRQYEALRNGMLQRNAEAMVRDKIREVLRVYAAACRG